MMQGTVTGGGFAILEPGQLFVHNGVTYQALEPMLAPQGQEPAGAYKEVVQRDSAV